jgi:hypothetical protein
MVVSSAGFRPKSDCSGKAQKQLYSKLQTRPLVRDGAPHQEAPTLRQKKKSQREGYHKEDQDGDVWIILRWILEK